MDARRVTMMTRVLAAFAAVMAACACLLWAPQAAHADVAQHRMSSDDYVFPHKVVGLDFSQATLNKDLSYASFPGTSSEIVIEGNKSISVRLPVASSAQSQAYYDAIGSNGEVVAFFENCGYYETDAGMSPIHLKVTVKDFQVARKDQFCNNRPTIFYDPDDLKSDKNKFWNEFSYDGRGSGFMFRLQTPYVRLYGNADDQSRAVGWESFEITYELYVGNMSNSVLQMRPDEVLMTSCDSLDADFLGVEGVQANPNGAAEGNITDSYITAASNVVNRTLDSSSNRNSNYDNTYTRRTLTNTASQPVFYGTYPDHRGRADIEAGIRNYNGYDWEAINNYSRATATPPAYSDGFDASVLFATKPGSKARMTYKIFDTVADIGFILNLFPSFGGGGASPEKEVSTQTAFEGGEYTYTLRGSTPKRNSTASSTFSYYEYRFDDTLPDGATYAGGASLRWVNKRTGQSYDVLADATVSGSGRNVSAVLSESWLRSNGLLYGVEGELVFSFKARVAEDADSHFTGDGKLKRLLVNDFALTANGTKFTSNDVYTYVPPDPGKAADKAVAEVDEHVTYTVTQKVNKRDAATPGWHYDSLELLDVLPLYLTYDAGSFKAFDTNGSDVTGRGRLTVTRASDGRDHLSFAFDADWVRNNLDYNGKAITFKFSGTVEDPGHQTGMYVLRNTATTRVNNHSLVTNEVQTKVPVWWVEVSKYSTNDVISDANKAAYRFSGAVFSVTRQNDGYSPGNITTVEKANAQGRRYGWGELRVVHSGTYDVAETVAPPGFSRTREVKQAVLSSTNYVERLKFDFSNDPLFAELAFKKVDADYYLADWSGKPAEHFDGTDWWQGDVPDFSAMRARARYFGNMDWSGSAAASAVWAADRLGMVDMPGKAPAEGTWPYAMGGRNVVPLGTFDVTETVPPVGYVLDSTVRRCKVVEVDDKAVVVPGESWSSWNGRG